MVRRVCALILGLCLSSCLGPLAEVTQDEVGRVPNQTGTIDAVLFETNGGATTSFGYRVFVVPRGKQVDPAVDSAVVGLYAAVRSDSAYGVNLRWASANELGVEYLSAQQTVVHDSIFTVGQQPLRITLRSGISDPRAPGGGMLYNLHGRLR